MRGQSSLPAYTPLLFHAPVLEVRRPSQRPDRTCCMRCEAAPTRLFHLHLLAVSSRQPVGGSSLANLRLADLHQTSATPRFPARSTRMLPVAIRFFVEQQQHPLRYASPQSA